MQHTLFIKSKNMSIIVFDTETTNLIPNVDFNNFTETMLENCPHMVEFSYIVYDINENKIVKMSDNYISLPENVEITKENTKIHGITNKTIQKYSVQLEDLIDEFMDYYVKATKIIGHNINFDIKIVLIGLMRLIIKKGKKDLLTYYNILLDSLNTQNNVFCTMRKSINTCNIIKINKNGNPYKKFPKLIELYKILFNNEPQRLHNSLVDCFCCLRCFIKLVHNYDVSTKNKPIKNFICLIT
jgi:DNA polymerase-3 subunit epsilon